MPNPDPSQLSTAGLIRAARETAPVMRAHGENLVANLLERLADALEEEHKRVESKLPKPSQLRGLAKGMTEGQKAEDYLRELRGEAGTNG